MFQRVKQFYDYLTASVDSDDRRYVDKYLNSGEKKLFNKLAVHEQKHSINVAKDIENMYDKSLVKSDDLIKVALLHDIGKVKIKMSIIDKSIIVILDKITRGKMKKFQNIKKIYGYYYHADDGAEILKELEESSRILYLIKNHHNKNIKDDLELNILKICDDRN